MGFENLLVKGFLGDLKRLNGDYKSGIKSHGRTTYQKGNGPAKICVYYWSPNDGMQGWWIGPEINGDEIWARNPSSSLTPPEKGWFAPWEAKSPSPFIEFSMRNAQGAPTGDIKTNIIPKGLKRPDQSTSTIPAKRQRTEEEIKEIFEKLEKTTLPEIKTAVQECEETVDRLKDTGVMFSCEVVDHMGFEEVLEVKKKTDEVGKEATDQVTKIRKLLDQSRIEMDACRSLGEKYTELRTSYEGCNKQVQIQYKDTQKLLQDVARGSQKAVQKKKQEEAMARAEEAKKKIADAQKIQRLAVQKSTAFVMLSKPLQKKLPEMNNIKDLVDAERTVLAMIKDINEDIPHCTQLAHASMKSALMFLKMYQKSIHSKRKERQQVDLAKVDELGTLLAQEIQKWMAKESLSEEEAFATVAQTEAEMTATHFEEFVEKTLDIGDKFEKNLIFVIFSRALNLAATEKGKESLSKEEFFLHVAHTIYTSKGIEMELDDEEKKKIKLDDGELVEIIEGPIEEPLRARCKRIIDGAIGWIPFQALTRFSFLFTVLQETVLTDKHDLKHFTVLRRLKAGAKLKATKVPAIDCAAKLLRIRVLVDDETGYVTVKGNRGSQLLKNEPSPLPPLGEEALEPKEISTEEWTNRFVEHTTSIIEGLKTDISAIIALHEETIQKAMSLEALAEGSTTKEVIEEPAAEALEAWTKVDGLMEELSKKIINLSREVQGVSAEVEGPLTSFKTGIEETQTKLLEAKKKHIEGTKRARELHKKMTFELMAQKKLELQKEEEDFVKKLADEAITKKENINVIIGNLTKEVEEEAEVVALQDLSEEALTTIKDVRTWVEESQVSIRPKAVKKLECQRALTELNAVLVKLKATMDMKKSQLGVMWSDLEDKAASSLAKALRDHMEMSQMTEEILFKDIAKESNYITLETFIDYLRVLKLDYSDHILGKIFHKVCIKGSAGVNASQFCFLTNCYFKVVRATTLTDTLSIKTSKRIKTLKVDDSLQVLGPMEIDPDSRVRRVHVLSGTEEGFVTVKGNQGTVFLERQSYFYKVTKETVLTDKFEMTDFRVIRRLKVGDIIRSLSLPKEDAKSSLWRIQVLVLQSKTQSSANDKRVGWVTIKGNQGTAFLEGADVDGMEFDVPIEELLLEAAEQSPVVVETKVEKKDVEMKDKEEVEKKAKEEKKKKEEEEAAETKRMQEEEKRAAIAAGEEEEKALLAKKNWREGKINKGAEGRKEKATCRKKNGSGTRRRNET